MPPPSFELRKLVLDQRIKEARQRLALLVQEKNELEAKGFRVQKLEDHAERLRHAKQNQIQVEVLLTADSELEPEIIKVSWANIKLKDSSHTLQANILGEI